MTNQKQQKNSAERKWTSPIQQERWKGYRDIFRGADAFVSRENFESAQVRELENCLEEQEKEALGRLLQRGKKPEIEVFLKTHGANPIFPPQLEMDIPVGVVKADIVPLSKLASAEGNAAILEGQVVYALFQAGEATRFNRGPLYGLNPLEMAREEADALGLHEDIRKIEEAKKTLNAKVGTFLTEGNLGPKQPFLILAGLRRVVEDEVAQGRLDIKNARKRYEEAIQNQKLLFFIGSHGGVNKDHEKALRETYKFFGFRPENIVTIEQEAVYGITSDEYGRISLLKEDYAMDPVGHLYAFLQGVRPGNFLTYNKSGIPTSPKATDALAYLLERGGKFLSIVRINDMDRHSTEIVNSKALSYAIRKFSEGYSNVIEGVGNVGGQKGGTGTTFHDSEIHVLTETHENSFPALSRAFETGMKEYLEKSGGNHPAYNAMRQWADLDKTRTALKTYGGRIVFVPRQKIVNEETVSYLGVDMPMGDLSLLLDEYRSRMFQFVGPQEKDLLIHDMKKKENLSIALRTILHQCKDPFVVSAAKEFFLKKKVPFSGEKAPFLYGAPVPEFEN